MFVIKHLKSNKFLYYCGRAWPVQMDLSEALAKEREIVKHLSKDKAKTFVTRNGAESWLSRASNSRWTNKAGIKFTDHFRVEEILI